MDLTALLASQLAKPLATLLARTALGDAGGTAAGGLLNVAEQLTHGYLDQKEVVRHYERIGDKIVERLEPRFRQAVDEGGVDVEKVAAACSANRSPRGSISCITPLKSIWPVTDSLTSATRERWPNMRSTRPGNLPSCLLPAAVRSVSPIV